MSRKLLTKKEAADRLSVSMRTLEGLISRGALPAYRVGAALVRISEDDLDRYLAARLVVPAPKEKIRSRFLRSFLHYVPYACLTAMTIPDILYSTASFASAAVGLVVAILVARRGKGLLEVALWACAAVFAAERVLPLIGL